MISRPVLTMLCAALCAVSFSACTSPASQQGEAERRWADLFDGKSLDGWQLINGDLPFYVEDGEIIGETAIDIPTRYLTTKARYDDFILELEVNNSESQISGAQNSGIQFRSEIGVPFYSGLTGYQMEIDPTSRAWTGGIYFEGLWRWRHPPIENPNCAAAWDAKDWNRFRIEAKGAKMRTFVNGVACAFLYDETLKDGHIGLQIHSIGQQPAAAGAKTRWRNIRIIDQPKDVDFTVSNLSLTSSKIDSESYLINSLSPLEVAAGWTFLRPRAVNKPQWTRAKTLNPVTGTAQNIDVLNLSAGSTQDTAVFSLPKLNYHFIVDIEMSPTTQGEIIYPVSVKNAQGHVATAHGSYRIFDDRSLAAPDINDPNLMAAVTEHIAAGNLSEPNGTKRVLAPSAWQRLEIKVKDGRAEHWLNGVKAAQYSGLEKLKALEANPDTLTLKIDSGRASFRSIKIK